MLLLCFTFVYVILAVCVFARVCRCMCVWMRIKRNNEMWAVMVLEHRCLYKHPNIHIHRLVLNSSFSQYVINNYSRLVQCDNCVYTQRQDITFFHFIFGWFWLWYFSQSNKISHSLCMSLFITIYPFIYIHFHSLYWNEQKLSHILLNVLFFDFHINILQHWMNSFNINDICAMSLN